MSLVGILLSVLVYTSIAQPKDEYDAHWKKVQDLEKKGLTQSALQEVRVIYDLALKKNNDAQQVKAAIYQVKYRNMVQEASHENNIFYIDTLIEKAKAPAKNILQSMQAEMFWQYVQNNRWKFYNRTKLAEESSKDISTWSLDKLYGVISKLYLASLHNETILKATRLEAYDPIIIKGKNTRQLRPTLYDFLAHRALDYFKNDEKDITKPAYQFTINDERAFAPIETFIIISFKTKDTASLQHKALLLFQEILKFHLHDAKPDALVDADLERLAFIHEYGVMENKEKMYEAALMDIENRYENNPVSAQASYLRAKIYYDRGDEYEPFTKTENQYDKKKARQVCERVIARFPTSEGAINCSNLLKKIDQPTLSLETEQVNIPNQPFRSLVKYTNIKTLYLRVIPISGDKVADLLQNNNPSQWTSLLAITATRNWNISLPDPGDYQNHSVEIKVDGLSPGTYFILASIDAGFSLTKNIISRQLTYVSNISYINNGNNYYILNRDNGQPLANAQVQAWERTYNQGNRAYSDVKAEQYTSDKNGYFKLKKTKHNREILLQVKYNGDELFMHDYYDYYENTSTEREVKPVTYLFTDRSIYRPGQTVYFKGIVLKKGSTKEPAKVLSSFKTNLQLRDANFQKVSQLKLVTNEYGSYNGSFILPVAGMNGRFSLYDSITNTTEYFNVEEYKRPKFYVQVQKPKSTYRLNDSVTVIGYAKAYAGNNIDGAQVKYRVVRKVQYPTWWDWRFYNKRPAYNGNEEVEIGNGELTTDVKGQFVINFKALPDESVDKKDQPIFYYEVSVDITDINGETRSGNASVAVSYQALLLNIGVIDKLETDSLKNLYISSNTMNGVFEKTKVNVLIYQLNTPDKIFRKRLWDMPDQFIMRKDEFESYFPYDVYKNEDNMSSWQLGVKVFDQTDSTKENGQFSIGNKKIPGGWYKIIVMAKDKYGEEVRVETYIQVADIALPVVAPISFELNKSTFEPAEHVHYTIKTGFDDIWLIHTLTKMDNTVITSYQPVKKIMPFQNDITVMEIDRGGMDINYVFVKHNSIYKGDQQIGVPWTNKHLTISYETFRDKLLPGSEEQWKIKISGNRGEKLAAEMLAAMYDASLDQFKPHRWNRLDIWPQLSKNNISWEENGFGKVESDECNKRLIDYLIGPQKTYDKLIFLSRNLNEKYLNRKTNVVSFAAPTIVEVKEDVKISLNEVVVTGDFKRNLSSSIANIIVFDSSGLIKDNKNTFSQSPNVQIRKNFNETAFFFPSLYTDKDGNITFSFTIPEALTQWKLMLLAHTKELASGYSEKTVMTQKPLMVQPNAPRFLREGDKMEFTAKIVNMGDSVLSGTAVLELLDAATNKPIDGLFGNIHTSQPFHITAGQSGLVTFPLTIPVNFNSALVYRIVARAGQYSDGEEMALPVLTNRMLVTETLPLNLRNQQTKASRFDKLLNSGNSTTLSNHALTIEYTSNPGWYAVQALPYLVEYPYECAEQTFNKYYANVLAGYISNSSPMIKAVFEKWKNLDTAALLSGLQKNEELKSALLEETPWVMDALNENQQKKNIALLFDMVKMSDQQQKEFKKLEDMQGTNGGFAWFKGGPDDRYITQYIITGIGHLMKLGALSPNDYLLIKPLVLKAISYLDARINDDYNQLLRSKAKLTNNNLGNTAIQYLYMRSFFQQYAIPATSMTAYNYYLGQAKEYWLGNSKYMQAMIALALYRTGDMTTPAAIIRSLKENAINKEEMGMYWKEWTTGGYYWYQSPIESQALMIEAFTDIEKNTTTIDDLKTWLLKQKQVQNWKTTKATAEACYALLLGGTNWLAEEKEVVISLGNTIIKSTDDATEAGTGYFKKRIEGNKVNASMGNIHVEVSSANGKPLNTSSTSWGSVYWQYFEDMDKITPAETPLKLHKQLFIERNSDNGPVLVALTEGARLKVGDKVKVRIELRADRDMEYVHMKDMRASCMEPVNVISEYKYQGGLGYYESTKDASTNFFFGWLPRGTYVFEYPLFVTHSGNFSNGITTIQCMYAPEFSSHSEGIRVNVQ